MTTRSISRPASSRSPQGGRGGRSGRSTGGSRTRELAGRYRRTGRILSLSADFTESVATISAGLAEIAGRYDGVSTDVDSAIDATLTTADILDVVIDDGMSAGDTAVDASSVIETAQERFAAASGRLIRLRDLLQRGESLEAATQDRTVKIAEMSIAGKDLVSRALRLAEKLEIAGLNGTLEAGKLDEPGRPFGLAAEGVQRISARFSTAADDLESAVSAVTGGFGEVRDLTKRVADRSKTIAAMTKSVTGAWEDVSVAADELRAGLDVMIIETSERAAIEEHVVEACGLLAETLSGFGKYLFDAAESRRELAEKWAVISDAAGSVADTAERIADSDSPERVYDDLAEAVDRVVLAIEQAESPQDVEDSAFSSDSDVLVSVSESVDSFFNMFDALKSNGSGEDKIDEIPADRSAEIIVERIRDIRTILGEIVTELETLAENREAVAGKLASVASGIDTVRRFADRCNETGSALDCLAVQGAIEQNALGAAGKPLGRFVKDFRTIASEAAALAGDTAGFSTALRASALASAATQTGAVWQRARETADDLARRLDELVAASLGEATEACAAAVQIELSHDDGFSEAEKSAASLREAFGTMRNSLGSVSADIEGISARTDELLGIADRIFAALDSLETE